MTVTAVDAPFAKYSAFIDILAGGADVASGAYFVALTDRVPNPASDRYFNATTAPPPAAADGYTTGGNALTTTPTMDNPSGTFTLTANPTVFTAGAGGIGPFRYPVLYVTISGTDYLVASYDNGASVSLGNADTFTVNFGTLVYSIS
jgi:hypothetical protein